MRNKEDEASRKRSLANRQRILGLLEEQAFQAGIEPATASASLMIWSYCQVQTEIETNHVGRLSSADMLTALEKLEKWYRKESSISEYRMA